jgi:hypothetical protein
VARVGALLVALLRARDLHDFALKLLPVLAKRGFAWAAAFLVHRTIRPLTPGPRPFRVLIIEKAIFNDDMLQVLADSPDMQAFGLRRAIVKSLALAYLPKAVCDDATYVSDDPATERAKLRYRAFLARMWSRLARLDRYDVVVTGNWCYWAERELATALEAQGVPFVVLHKEGIKPPERSRMLRDLFERTRGRFTGRRVLVYQEAEREHQIEGRIARPEQIRIVGMPRLDRLHAWRIAAVEGRRAFRAERPTVLFLAFMPNNFLPSYSGIASDLAWDELCAGSYRAIARLAREHPEIRVIVRPRGYEIPECRALLARVGDVPENIEVIADGNVEPLIEASWVIVGHNTTVVLEAYAAGKPVVVPRFAEALDPRYSGYIVDIGREAEYASSVDDMVARLARRCTEPVMAPRELSDAAKSALAQWTGNPDGRASERVHSALLQEIADARR